MMNSGILSQPALRVIDGLRSSPKAIIRMVAWFFHYASCAMIREGSWRAFALQTSHSTLRAGKPNTTKVLLTNLL
jgi:hypothetical protein